MVTRAKTLSSVPAKPRVRNDPRRQRTRARILEAATELVHAEGLADLTVSGLMRRAGVHQSLFYKHFDDLEDCLAAAGRKLAEDIAPRDEGLRRAVSWQGSFNVPEQARFFEDAFERWLDAGPLVELLITHRLDGSAFGKALRPVADRQRDEVAAELWEWLAPLGVRGETMHEVRLIADQLVSGYYWALEVLIDRRAHDRKALARTLAESQQAIIDALRKRALEADPISVARRSLPESTRQQARGLLGGLRALLGSLDDLTIVTRFGSADALVDQALAGMSRVFVRELCPRECVVRYQVHTPQGQQLIRTMRMGAQGCELLGADESVPSTFTLHLSLRTLLEMLAGTTDPNRTFIEGKTRVDGDMVLASEMSGWFYPFD